jgi:hypothetical protein
LIRVGELLTVLMDGGLGTAALHQAGRHLIESEHHSSHDHLEPDATMQPIPRRQKVTGAMDVSSPPRPPAQVSCKITITKMMMTNTPIMVPINPLFMDRPPLLLLTRLFRVRVESMNQPTVYGVNPSPAYDPLG